jgi:iron-sulfur cluster repair protein YtfE (RIC family)
MHCIELAHAFESAKYSFCCGTKLVLKATGMRRMLRSLGAALIQASSAGSNELQWEQLYQKNSITSTLPAGASGVSGLASLV